MRYPEEEFLREIKKIHHQTPRWVIGLIAVGVLVVLAWYTAGLFAILLISGIIAYLFSSLIKRIQYFGIRRNVAVAVLYAAAFLLLIGADVLFLPYLKHESENLTTRLPDISRQAEDAFSDLKGYPFAEELVDKVLEGIARPGHLLSRVLNLPELFSQAASLAFALILIPFFTFFILKDWPDMLKAVMRRLPAAYVETAVATLEEINVLAGKYLRGLAIDCFSVGCIASAGLWMMGISYPFTLGVITGAANVIPYVGPVISCTAAALIAFVQFKSAGAVVHVLGLYIVVKLADDFFIQPMTIGRSVRLHPMLLIISIIAGQKLFGILGMILAVPAVTILQKIAQILLDHRQRLRSRTAPSAHIQKIIV
ncbi:MAG: AI-2E family transporter [Nitrospirae bacterium]|nr:AI-2E family transporter [Nitrospirota bacterium]